MKKLLKPALVVIMAVMTACGEAQKNEENGQLHLLTHPDYNRGRYVVTDGESLYTGYKSTVYKTDSSGTFPLATVESGYISRVISLNDKIYFCTVDKMYTVNSDGSGFSEVISMTYDNGSIRWLDAEAVGKEIYLSDPYDGNTRSKLLFTSEEGYSTENAEYEHKYINRSGMVYRYIPTGQCGGNLTMTGENGEQINIVNINSPVLAEVTDDYIFTLSGILNDGSEDVSLYRWSLEADRSEGITAFDSNISFISFVGYDSDNVYIRDSYNEKYYGVNQHDGTVTELPVDYIRGVYPDIVDGWRYYIPTEVPYCINLATGERENLNFE